MKNLTHPPEDWHKDGEDTVDGANEGDNRENHKPCQKKVKLVINVLSSTNQK